MEMASVLLTITYFFLFMGSKTGEGSDPDVRFTSRNSIECKDNYNGSTFVNIQPRNQVFQLIDLLNGSANIDFGTTPIDKVLLSFANNQSNKYDAFDQVNCWSPTNTSIMINNLTENDTHTFCLMNESAQTVSPLDCLSFRPRNALDDYDPIWLSDADKPLAIGLLVMALLICLAFGCGIGVLIVQRQANVQNRFKQNFSTRSESMTPDWKRENKIRDFSYPYTDDDTASIASGKSYVTAVNPSRFDLIKMRLEKAENPVQIESENQYDLEDMPYSTAPAAPFYRDSGISTSGPIYAISSKVMGQNESDNCENLYLCVDGGDNNDNCKKFE